MRVLAFLCFGSLAIFAAQDSPPAPITIDQAVQEALSRNLDLMAQRYDLSIADAHILAARLRPNPVFSAGLDYVDMLGTPFNNATSAGPTEYNARLDFLLERGGKRERRVEVAQDAKQVAQYQLLNAARNLILDVQGAFVDVLQAKENLALARENLKDFDAIVQVNTVRVRAGDLSRVELLRTQVAALQFRSNVRQAESRLRLAGNHLQALLGRTVFAPDFDVTGGLRRDPVAATEQQLQQEALQRRPDVLALQRDQARSLADIRLQIAQGKVDYTVGTEFHRQFYNGIGSSMGFFFSAPLPLFNRNQGEIARAQHEQEQILARMRALQAEVRSEVRNAWVQYTTARDLLDSIERDMLSQARDVRQITEYSYRRGEASFVEFLDAQRAYNDTMQGYNEARAEYARSRYTIESVTGQGARP